MSAKNDIYYRTALPNSGFLVIPNRLGFREVLMLEQVFNKENLVWFIEDSYIDGLDNTTLSHLNREGTAYHHFNQEDYDSIEAVKQRISSCIKDGKKVIFLASEAATNLGSLFHITGKTLDIITEFKFPTIPLFTNAPKEVTHQLDPEELPTSTLSFGDIIRPEDISTATWQSALFSLSEEAFSKRSILELSLPYALLLGLKKHGKTRKIHDGADDTSLTYDKVLAASLALSSLIQAETENTRVGIILPPGKAGLIANLAVLFAGKVPVNLNFTASKEAIESAMTQAQLDRFITGSAFIKKVPSFPWPHDSQLILLEKTLPTLKKSMIRWGILSKILPSTLLAKIIGISQYGGDEEAVLLFTSGSSGEPKGVPLSHRNLLANVTQFGSSINLSNSASILGCLPLFHSFGSTVTLWFPIIQGLNLITFPSPLDTKRLASLVEEHNVELLLSTPTFLRGFMKRVKPEQLASVNTCITGAEKLPHSVAQAFHDKFGILPLEGYGLTEASPATNLNTPDQKNHSKGVKISSNFSGSVGRPLNGIAVKMTDVETDKEIPLNQTGIVWLKGANIFKGYLNNPEKTKEVIQNNWFKTGDVGKVDSNGFLFIEGRISRFSKIAGEMVPHEGVEEAINKALDLSQEEERRFAIVSIPDKQKGEALAMLSTLHTEHLDQECIALKYSLMDAGIPSLWCPKKIIYIDKIPVLASGKLDIKTCEMAAQ